jgi:hypothetical protein
VLGSQAAFVRHLAGAPVFNFEAVKKLNLGNGFKKILN